MQKNNKKQYLENFLRQKNLQEEEYNKRFENDIRDFSRELDKSDLGSYLSKNKLKTEFLKYIKTYPEIIFSLQERLENTKLLSKHSLFYNEGLITSLKNITKSNVEGVFFGMLNNQERLNYLTNKLCKSKEINLDEEKNTVRLSQFVKFDKEKHGNKYLEVRLDTDNGNLNMEAENIIDTKNGRSKNTGYGYSNYRFNDSVVLKYQNSHEMLDYANKLSKSKQFETINLFQLDSPPENQNIEQLSHSESAIFFNPSEENNHSLEIISESPSQEESRLSQDINNVDENIQQPEQNSINNNIENKNHFKLNNTELINFIKKDQANFDTLNQNLAEHPKQFREVNSISLNNVEGDGYFLYKNKPYFLKDIPDNLNLGEVLFFITLNPYERFNYIKSGLVKENLNLEDEVLVNNPLKLSLDRGAFVAKSKIDVELELKQTENNTLSEPSLKIKIHTKPRKNIISRIKDLAEKRKTQHQMLRHELNLSGDLEVLSGVRSCLDYDSKMNEKPNSTLENIQKKSRKRWF